MIVNELIAKLLAYPPNATINIICTDMDAGIPTDTDYFEDGNKVFIYCE